MKTQVLSRNQSVDNVPISGTLQLKKFHKKQNPKLNTQLTSSICRENLGQQNPYLSTKMISQPYKLPSRKFLLNTSKYESNKNLKSCSDKKNRYSSLHFGLKTLKKSQQNKKQLINKKNLQKFGQKQIKSFNTIQDERIKGVQIIKQSKTFNMIPSKKSSYSVIRNAKQYLEKGEIEYQSDNKIKTLKLKEEYQRQIQLLNKRATNYLLKTAAAFKDYNLTPYISINQKKKENRQKNRPSHSLYRISTSQAMQRQQDVSIQLIQQNKEDFDKQMSVQFNCSEIKQKQIQADSQFLQDSQRALFQFIDEKSKKQQIKKRKWGRLPNDFLKS